jgi:hypothetical protein
VPDLLCKLLLEEARDGRLAHLGTSLRCTTQTLRRMRDEIVQILEIAADTRATDLASLRHLKERVRANTTLHEALDIDPKCVSDHDLLRYRKNTNGNDAAAEAAASFFNQTLARANFFMISSVRI